MCLPVDPVCDVNSVIGTVGAQVAGSVFDQTAQSFADAAAKLTTWMWSVITATTTVSLSGGWFSSTLGLTTTLAGVLIVAIFVLELTRAALRRDAGALTRATVGVGAGILAASAAVTILEALLAATDAVCDDIVHTTGVSSLTELGTRVAPVGLLATVPAPALVFLLALGYLIASFLIWALFLARKAMLIVAAVFAPVAFSGAAAHSTRGWVRKWLEFTLAMVFSKIVIVVLFTLAVSLIGTPGSGMAAVGNLFTGLAMLLLACFAPATLFRLVHYLGGDLIAAHHHSLTTSVAHAGATPIAMARTAAVRINGLTTPGATTAPTAATQTAGTSTATRTDPSPAVNVPGAATGLPPAKSLTNNPIIKNSGGEAGPATGSSASPPTGPPGPAGGGGSKPGARNAKPATAAPPHAPLPPSATPPPARPAASRGLPGT
jgi:hypothetical protein